MLVNTATGAVWGVLLAGVCCVAPLWAEETPSPEQAARMAGLIEQLGADQFTAREEAHAEIIKIGLPALAAVQAGTKHVDREIRFRCERILTIVQEVDFERRLESFAAGKMSAEDANLPCWERFKKLLGEGQAERTLFIEFVRQESQMLRAAQDKPSTEADLVRGRIQQLQQLMRFQQNMPSATVGAMLLLSAGDNVKLDDGAAQMLYSYCGMQPAYAAFDNGSQKDQYRKLLGVCLRRVGGQGATYSALQLAMRLELPEGLPMAEDLAKVGGNAPWIRQMAIFAIAKLGSDKQIPLLEELLKDEGVCHQQQFQENGKQIMYTTQVRDCALASLLHLTKQDFKAYGMDRISTNPQWVFNFGSMGYQNTEKRDAALKKWHTWRDDQKKKPAEAPKPAANAAPAASEAVKEAATPPK